MPKSNKKRANPFVEQYGFKVDRIIRSDVPNTTQAIPGSSQEGYAILSQNCHPTFEDDCTKDLDGQLDLSVEICSFIEEHEE